MSFTSYKLGDICRMKYGKMPPKAIVASEGFPIFSGYRITGCAKEYLYDEPHVIVVARGVGGTGDVKMSPEKSWVTNLSIVLEHEKKIVDKLFLLYRLGREPLKEKLNTGAAQAQITIDSLSAYSITLPPLEVQIRIASVISAYDDLIENNRRRIQLLEESARLLYREWFALLRFPGHEHVKVVDGVPEGWRWMPLGEAFTLQRGFDLPVKKRKSGGIPIYASTGITGYHDIPKVKAPGVVTGRSGSLGHVMYVQEDFWPLNTTLWVKQFEKVDPFYAYFVLEGLQLQRLNGGAAVPTLNRNDVHPIEILIPDSTTLELFTDIVEPLFSQQKMLTEYNAKLSETRDLLLPRLMNGEVAV